MKYTPFNSNSQFEIGTSVLRIPRCAAQLVCARSHLGMLTTRFQIENCCPFKITG